MGRTGAWAVALAALASCSAPAADAGWPSPPPSAVRATVARVVDGDTIVVRGIDVGKPDRSTGGRVVRLIGIDTPEIHGRTGCYGTQAAGFTRRRLGSREVLVAFDVDVTDRYGRALAYVWRDGVLFNAELVRDGYAQQLTVPPNVRYAELFRRLVVQARRDGRGLWGSACRE